MNPENIWSVSGQYLSIVNLLLKILSSYYYETDERYLTMIVYLYQCQLDSAQ